jgi:hypothetical protein
MAKPAPRRMIVDEFLQWDDGTDTRYELVGGEIVAMAPAMPDHATIVSNLDRELGRGLRAPALCLRARGWSDRTATVISTCPTCWRHASRSPAAAAMYRLPD